MDTTSPIHKGFAKPPQAIRINELKSLAFPARACTESKIHSTLVSCSAHSIGTTEPVSWETKKRMIKMLAPCHVCFVSLFQLTGQALALNRCIVSALQSRPVGVIGVRAGGGT